MGSITSRGTSLRITALFLAVGATAGGASAASAAPPPSTSAQRSLVPTADSTIHVAGIPGRLWLWATVEHASVVRSAPNEMAGKVGVVQTKTPEGTAGNVQIIGTTTVAGEAWVKVSFPSLPNGLTGWVPQTALGAVHLVDTQLTIDRATFVATLRRAGRVVFTAPVGVGRRSSPTPAGSFFVRDRLAGFSNAPSYGPIAFGTSARSEKLTEWPGGGYIGLHGTDRPDLIPGRISKGCVRFRNPDILRLAKLMPVGSSVRIL